MRASCRVITLAAAGRGSCSLNLPGGVTVAKVRCEPKLNFRALARMFVKGPVSEMKLAGFGEALWEL